MQIEHKWDAESGVATCIVYDKDMQFVGEAKCHADDAEYSSAITGGYIAEGRAFIKLYQHEKNNVLRPQINLLQHMSNTFKSYKNYNPKDRSVVRIEKELEKKKLEFKRTKEAIENEKENLKEYIRKKDEYHKYLGKRKQSSK
jgi:hypothetical protein